MGKIIEAKFAGYCRQTGKKIKKGDSAYYIPGRGTFCSESKIYQEYKESKSIADHIQANEDAYFDNFCRNNNI